MLSPDVCTKTLKDLDFPTNLIEVNANDSLVTILQRMIECPDGHFVYLSTHQKIIDLMDFIGYLIKWLDGEMPDSCFGSPSDFENVLSKLDAYKFIDLHHTEKNNTKIFEDNVSIFNVLRILTNLRHIVVKSSSGEIKCVLTPYLMLKYIYQNNLIQNLSTTTDEIFKIIKVKVPLTLSCEIPVIDVLRSLERYDISACLLLSEENVPLTNFSLSDIVIPFLNDPHKLLGDALSMVSANRSVKTDTIAPIITSLRSDTLNTLIEKLTITHTHHLWIFDHHQLYSVLTCRDILEFLIKSSKSLSCHVDF
eukprot:TRINITY_DN3276_c2_g8_i1.p1 TRINITY_DN3276_c2_g8~~TRINITY_DN3276_c2_g8_i1.p1  ORF type:complete len:308 (+),score=61.43 TRINITY_DN3276_c2_g8_i1:159-1082(+)